MKKKNSHTLTSKADINIKKTLDYIWEIIPDFSLDIYKYGYSGY